jgi:hypothetical protein
MRIRIHNTVRKNESYCRKVARGKYCNMSAKMEGLFIYSFYDARPPEETHSLNLFMPHFQEQGS